MFWILVCLLVLIAIAFLTFPLWRRASALGAEEAVDALNVLRDQRSELDDEVAAGRISEAERETRIVELTRRVHDEGLTAPVTPTPPARPVRKLWLALALTILIPVIALPLYIMVGTPAALDPLARAPAAAPASHGDFTPQQLHAMLDNLKAKLDAKPDDAAGWMMLGRGLQLVDDFAGSAAAFEKAVALQPNDPQLLSDYADSLGMSRNRDLSGKPWELIQKALQVNPQWPKALALAASAELAQGRFDSAKGYWQRLLAVVPPDSEDATEIRGMIAQLDAKATGVVPGVSPAVAPVAAATAAVPVVPGKTLTGTVKLAPALAAQVKPDDVVYLFARAPEGSRMPLAIIRLKVSDLPKQFQLDDTQGMAGGRALSSMPQVRIEARVSKSGDARPAPGDLRGESAVVVPGAKGVDIVISEVITSVPASPPMGAQPGAAPGMPTGPGPAMPPRAPVTAAAAPTSAAPTASSASPKQTTGIVRLAPALAAKVAPDDTLFIFARAAEGPRMPLAILRLKASELPKQFRLDDTLGMAGGPTLSSVAQVKIEARISKSGEALPKPGDLRGESTIVTPGTSNIEILIDRAVP